MTISGENSELPPGIVILPGGIEILPERHTVQDEVGEEIDVYSLQQNLSSGQLEFHGLVAVGNSPTHADGEAKSRVVAARVGNKLLQYNEIRNLRGPFDTELAFQSLRVTFRRLQARHKVQKALKQLRTESLQKVEPSL